MFSQILNALKNNGNDNPTSANSFYAPHELSPENFQIEVEGVGKINFPLDQTTIRKLQEISSEAKYGLGEKTLLDKRIRNTQEIAKEKLTIKCDKQAFENMLDNMRNSLGLSEHTKFSAHLHNMLIYAPGQFFKGHQDSEKLGGMIASLVIVLPSAHIGGSLVINHNDKIYRFTTENLDSQKIQCLAFYSDCHHEVEEVRQGYRVALTYNLVLEPLGDQLDSQENKQLEGALKEYFSLNGGTTAGPRKLIYFLDHSYTEHSLRWNMLKGGDRQRALDFHNAANKLGLLPHLALVELHESWTAEGDEDDPDPDELIDNSTTLSYWLDANNNKLPYKAYSISNDEACWTKDTEDFEPFDTQYEGYMGNYGNTVDYWYRRAAVVLWSASDQVAMAFRLDYDSAFKNLMALTENPDNKNQVLNIVRKVGASLYGCPPYAVKSNQFPSIASIAIYIQDQEIAKSILNVFSLGIFDRDEGIDWVVRLQNTYGAPWFLELMGLWKSQRNRMDSHSIQTDLDQVVIKLLAAGSDRKVALYLLDNQINYMVENNKNSRYQTPATLNRSLADRIHTLRSLLNACDLLSDEQATSKLISHVISNNALYPERDLGDIIIASKAFIEGNSLSAYCLLRDHVTKGIGQELDKGVRDPKDCSIPIRLGCTCNLCKTASAFLNSKMDSTKIWPLVTDGRQHIMDVFEQFDLPVALSVEKKGSPYKLVMVKSDKLYEDSKKRFDQLSEVYERLMNFVSRQDVI
jgi:hypothetical protein